MPSGNGTALIRKAGWAEAFDSSQSAIGKFIVSLPVQKTSRSFSRHLDFWDIVLGRSLVRTAHEFAIVCKSTVLWTVAWLRMTELLGYARVSTSGQELDAQRTRLVAAGVSRVFDDVISGRQFDRPGLTALLDYARPGDMICIVRLDRLGRSLRQLLETVEEFKRRQLGLMSLEERIDTSSAAGELVFHVFGAIAHFERRLISERTRDGLEVARRRGRRPGRPALDDDKLDAAWKLIQAGCTPTEAARHVGLGRSTLYRELRQHRCELAAETRAAIPDDRG